MKKFDLTNRFYTCLAITALLLALVIVYHYHQQGQEYLR